MQVDVAMCATLFTFVARKWSFEVVESQVDTKYKIKVDVVITHMSIRLLAVHLAETESVRGVNLLLDCYYGAWVTKSTGNKPGNKTSSLTFCIDYGTETKTDLNRKEPVRLRQRRIKNDGDSLYLDTYWNGKRSYDFLKLYLNPPTDDLAIIENKTTLELAKQIKYKRILELQTRPSWISSSKPRPKFRDFFAELASEKIRFDNNAGNWASAFKHVLVFLGDDNPTIQEIDDIWLEEFRAHLLEVDKRCGKPRLSSSTALSYFNRVRTALTTA